MVQRLGGSRSWNECTPSRKSLQNTADKQNRKSVIGEPQIEGRSVVVAGYKLAAEGGEREKVKQLERLNKHKRNRLLPYIRGREGKIEI